MNSKRQFEPTILGFLCNWCAYQAADVAGAARLKFAPNVRPVRLMCSGRVDPAFILKAFASGADGVLIAGCHPGECHYVAQNAHALRRVSLVKHTLERLGIDERRVRLEWVSAAEGARLADAIDEMVESLRRLGPLDWGRQWRQEETRVAAAVARTVERRREAARRRDD